MSPSLSLSLTIEAGSTPVARVAPTADALSLEPDGLLAAKVTCDAILATRAMDVLAQH